MIWDRGRWIPEGDPHKGYAKGHLTFDLEGQKLHGRWHLVRMRGRPNDRHENWLLIKGKDEAARAGIDAENLQDAAVSVASGRTMEEIAAGKGKKRVWHSNRKADGGKPQSQRAFREQLRGAAPAQRARRTAATVKASAAAKAEAATPRAQAGTKAKTRPAATALARRAGAPAAGRRASLPDFVAPSLASLRTVPPSGPGWLHEIKFDGYRLEARLDRGKVQLLTRNRQDWTHRFPPIAKAVAALPAERALLDGELVVENEQGISSFSLLQTDLKEGRSDRFVYWVFDLLYLEGRDLTGEALVARKAALEKLLAGTAGDGMIRYADHFDGEGPTIVKHASELGLEGIVSKRRDAPYRSGRSDNFIKVKFHLEQEFVVAGFAPSTAMTNAIGALIVAFHDNGKLRYAGRVGTGYTHETARDLWKRLAKLRVERPPLEVPKTERRKDVNWVKPDVVVEAEYRGITHDGLLRQASYKGLREDKPAREVVREAPADPPAPAAAGKAATARRAASESGMTRTASKSAPARSIDHQAQVANVKLTHAGRVYWADVGITKEDLAEYYVSVWDWMARHIVSRPMALLRCPEGTEGECFFQKHIPAIIKNSPLRRVVDGKEHDVIAVESLDDLIALVQSGALEIHIRGSRLDALEACDRIVFDFDPGEGVGWDDIVAAARETRDRLKRQKLESFVKLSGGKGVHVVVPVENADWDTTKNFAQEIALGMAADSPDRYVGKMTKALRPGKIFIDYLRNSRDATAVAPYSTRARPGAPVSAPLSWQQLGRTTSANQFTVLNLKKHFRGDPWRDIAKVRQRLPGK
jgi:bifunctional non-homologous end joining protein LigD